ncbi:MAG: HK97 family phage prohead protease [Pseudomonadota bacterium]
MNELDFALDTKAIDDEGRIEGLAVGYGNLDFGGDIVLPGAIKGLKKSIPMLMFHDQKRPAGVWTEFQETSEGLLAKGRFSLSTLTGKEAHGLVKDGAIGGLSMGYRALKHKIVGRARHLAEIALHEISLVTIPMNEKTLITSFKDILSGGELPTVREFEDFLREAGGFSKTLAAGIATKAQPLLNRGEPESADELAEFLKALQA